MIATTPRTADHSTRQRVWASLEVEPQARELANAHGLRLLLHGDHTFQLIDLKKREADRVLLTMFTDRDEVKLENGAEICLRNATVLDIVSGYLKTNGFTS